MVGYGGDRTSAAEWEAGESAAPLDPASAAARWALNPLQSFGSLFEIARELAAATPAATDRLTGDPVTNLYLAVCGLDQILSDHLHRHFYSLARAGLSHPWRSALDRVSAVEHGARRTFVRSRLSALVRAEIRLSRLSRRLGRQVLDGQAAPASDVGAEVSALASQPYPASLRRSVLKLPQSFRGVDLYPEDCALLAHRANDSMGTRPATVIGLRTSGLYMAALCAAALDRLGREDVELLSLRPGTPLLGHERRTLNRRAAAGAFAFVVDDPTWTGASFTKAHAALTALGFAPDRIVLSACEIGHQPVFQTGGSSPGVWSGFHDARKVVLGKSEWHVHSLLSDAVAERCLNGEESLRRLMATRVTITAGHPFGDAGEPPAVTGLEVAPRTRRFHAQKLYEVEVERDGEIRRELVVGRGVGLGAFGCHSYLVARALQGAVPGLLGFQDGVLFTSWEPGTAVDPETLSNEDLDSIASYIARRADALALPERQGSPPVESRAAYTGARLVARALGRTMGSFGALAQFRIAGVLSARLVTGRAAVVDGRMGSSEWIRAPSGSLLKLDFEEHGVDITDRRVTDPVHDVAGAAIGLRLSQSRVERLLTSYASATADREALPARFAYHTLMVGLAGLEAIQAGGEHRAAELVALEEGLSAGLRGYLAGLYLAGAPSREIGDVWAVDIDDTLETDWLGFPALSPAGALALRALARHDQVAILSSGRSLSEVRQRCASLGAAGGIAEYGAVAWDARHQRGISIVGPESLAELERLRAAVATKTDILVDDRYGHSLRLFRIAPEGRRAVDRRRLVELIDRHSIEGLEVVEGYRKTVVWANGTDKLAALRPLLESLGLDLPPRRLRCIGDSATDLALMRAAGAAYAPANADRAVREAARTLGIRIATRGWAAGVCQIVERELHAGNGRCETCGVIELEGPDRALVEVLGLQDRSRLERFAYALHPSSLRAFEL